MCGCVEQSSKELVSQSLSVPQAGSLEEERSVRRLVAQRLTQVPFTFLYSAVDL